MLIMPKEVKLNRCFETSHIMATPDPLATTSLDAFKRWFYNNEQEIFMDVSNIIRRAARSGRADILTFLNDPDIDLFSEYDTKIVGDIAIAARQADVLRFAESLGYVTKLWSNTSVSTWLMANGFVAKLPEFVGSKATIQFLVDTGLYDEQLYDTLREAVQEGCLATVRYLLTRVTPDRAMVEAAVKSHNLPMLSLLLHAAPQEAEAALAYAKDTIPSFLEGLITDEDYIARFIDAFIKGENPSISLIGALNNRAKLRSLLESGGYSDDIEPALAEAVKTGNSDAVKYLLEQPIPFGTRSESVRQSLVHTAIDNMDVYTLEELLIDRPHLAPEALEYAKSTAKNAARHYVSYSIDGGPRTETENEVTRYIERFQLGHRAPRGKKYLPVKPTPLQVGPLLKPVPAPLFLHIRPGGSAK